MRRARGYLIALALVGLALGWCATRGGKSSTAPPGAAPRAAPGDRPQPRAPRPSLGPTAAGRRRAAEAAAALPELPDTTVTGSLARFDRLCEYAPAARCARGRPLAAACAQGDGAACTQVADLLMTPPRMPHFAFLFLHAACDLKDPAACERWDQLLGWKLAAPAAAPGAPVSPSPAAAACSAGEATACWFQIQAESAGDQPIDLAAAGRGCDGGIADACTHLAQAAPDAVTAVAALERGCASGGVLPCRVLVGVYRGDAVCRPAPVPGDPGARHGRIPCPAPDPGRAAAVEARIRELTGKPYQPVPADPD